jgi:hypothetical protein
MDKFLGFKTEEILTFLLLIVVGYAIAKMFSGCGCNDGFSVGGATGGTYCKGPYDATDPTTYCTVIGTDNTEIQYKCNSEGTEACNSFSGGVCNDSSSPYFGQRQNKCPVMNPVPNIKIRSSDNSDRLQHLCGDTPNYLSNNRDLIYRGGDTIVGPPNYVNNEWEGSDRCIEQAPPAPAPPTPPPPPPVDESCTYSGDNKTKTNSRSFKDYVNEEKLDPLECPDFQVKIDECKDAWRNYYNDKNVQYDGSFCMQTLPDETMTDELKGRGHCPLMHDANGKPYPANWITNGKRFSPNDAKNRCKLSYLDGDPVGTIDEQENAPGRYAWVSETNKNDCDCPGSPPPAPPAPPVPLGIECDVDDLKCGRLCECPGANFNASGQCIDPSAKTCWRSQLTCEGPDSICYKGTTPPSSKKWIKCQDTVNSGFKQCVERNYSGPGFTPCDNGDCSNAMKQCQETCKPDICKDKKLMDGTSNPGTDKGDCPTQTPNQTCCYDKSIVPTDFYLHYKEETEAMISKCENDLHGKFTGPKSSQDVIDLKFPKLTGNNTGNELFCYYNDNEKHPDEHIKYCDNNPDYESGHGYFCSFPSNKKHNRNRHNLRDLRHKRNALKDQLDELRAQV